MLENKPSQGLVSGFDESGGEIRLFLRFPGNDSSSCPADELLSGNRRMVGSPAGHDDEELFRGGGASSSKDVGGGKEPKSFIRRRRKKRLEEMPASSGLGGAVVRVVRDVVEKKNKNCHFCEHAPKRCSLFSCFTPSCDQLFCENCCKRHIGRATGFLGQLDAARCDWRCSICTLECCCVKGTCTRDHMHCKRYRRMALKGQNKRKLPSSEHGDEKDGDYPLATLTSGHDEPAMYEEDA